MPSKKKIEDRGLDADFDKTHASFADDDKFIDVICSSAEKVSGFIRFSENFTDRLSYAFDIAKKYSGITLYHQIDKNGVHKLEVDLSIVLEFGVNVYDVCYNIKSSIISAIKKKYSDTDITCINIYVSSMENKKRQGKK